MAITAADVMKLRQMTGVSMMECKKALTKTDGDYDAAIKLLREHGAAVSAKRAEKAVKEGAIVAKTSECGKRIVLVEVNCETDFVSGSTDFKNFVQKVADLALAGEQDLVGVTKEDHENLVAKVGEKVEIRRADALELTGTGKLASYIHLGGKAGVIVEVGVEKAETLEAPEFQQLVKDLCLQITASSPRWLDRSQVPQDVIQTEMEINAKKLEAEQAEKGGKPKPREILEKIAMGQIGKFYTENCLVDQLYVKNAPGEKQTVAQLLAKVGKALGDTISVRRYVRYTLGA